jgi:hypothetical protein
MFWGSMWFWKSKESTECPSTRPLRRSFDQLDRGVKSWIEGAKLAA